MDLTYELIGMAIAGGMVAGIINTLAGNGSAITLTFLSEIAGLPGNIANGTNRIGILFQCITTSAEFHRQGKVEPYWIKRILPPVLSGALIGIVLATFISNDGFRKVFGVLLILLLLVILVKPKRWLSPDQENQVLGKFGQSVVYFGLGFYGGFIQMGMGVFFLASLVLISKLRLIPANVVKVVVIGIYTALALCVFAYHGMVDWKLGLSIGLGQGLGGWFTARMAGKYEWMEKAAYYMLIVIVLSAIIYFYDLASLIMNI